MMELRDFTALDELGWFNSNARQLPVDKNDAPLPWYTYCAIKFIEKKLRKDMNVFEYGCGYSTLWYARRTRFVHAIDNNKDWIGKISAFDVDNMELALREDLDGDYLSYIDELDLKFDVIVIDGRNRVKCAATAVRHLEPSGVVIFDNTDRESYLPAYEFLASQGFRRVDFEGIGPILTFCWATSIFYRDGNCFGL